MTAHERVLLAHHPHHLARRTQNNRVIFATEAHYEQCAQDIQDLAKAYQIRVCAWALLPDGFHLIATPGEDPQVLSSYMKSISCRASLRLARHYSRQKASLKRDKQAAPEVADSSSPWDSRFLSSPIERGQWLLAAMCFVEKLPVAEKLADTAFRYRHSSYRMRLGKTESYWLDDPQEYASLGDNLVERAQAYRNYFKIGLTPQVWSMIATAVKRGRLTGSRQFVEKVAREHGFFAPNRGPGRPRKPSKPKPPESPDSSDSSDSTPPEE